MKSKLLIIGLIASSLLAISVSAQEVKTIQELVLQDDKSGDHLIFIATTGEYKFESCGGNLSFGGIGKVSVAGCKVSLQDLSETRRVLAEVDLCAQAGKADIAFEADSFGGRIDAPPFEVVVSDSNTKDSTFDCAPKTINGK